MTDKYWLEQLDEQCREHNREVDGLYKRIADLEQLVRDTRNALYFMYNIRNDKLSAKRMDDIDRRIAELGIEVEE